MLGRGGQAGKGGRARGAGHATGCRQGGAKFLCVPITYSWAPRRNNFKHLRFTIGRPDGRILCITANFCVFRPCTFKRFDEAILQLFTFGRPDGKISCIHLPRLGRVLGILILTVPILKFVVCYIYFVISQKFGGLTVLSRACVIYRIVAKFEISQNSVIFRQKFHGIWLVLREISDVCLNSVYCLQNSSSDFKHDTLSDFEKKLVEWLLEK